MLLLSALEFAPQLLFASEIKKAFLLVD